LNFRGEKKKKIDERNLELVLAEIKQLQEGQVLHDVLLKVSEVIPAQFEDEEVLGLFQKGRQLRQLIRKK